MNRLVATAVFAVAACLTPIVPAQAAPLSDSELNCLVLPMLKKECWEMGAKAAAAGPKAVAMAAEDAAASVKVPFEWWNCTRAPEGSGHLLDC